VAYRINWPRAFFFWLHRLRCFSRFGHTPRRGLIFYCTCSWNSSHFGVWCTCCMFCISCRCNCKCCNCCRPFDAVVLREFVVVIVCVAIVVVVAAVGVVAVVIVFHVFAAFAVVVVFVAIGVIGFVGLFLYLLYLSRGLLIVSRR